MPGRPALPILVPREVCTPSLRLVVINLTRYATALDTVPAVRALHELARSEPAIPAYDEYLRSLGGDPSAALQEHI